MLKKTVASKLLSIPTHLFIATWDWRKQIFHSLFLRCEELWMKDKLKTDGMLMNMWSYDEKYFSPFSDTPALHTICFTLTWNSDFRNKQASVWPCVSGIGTQCHDYTGAKKQINPIFDIFIKKWKVGDNFGLLNVFSQEDLLPSWRFREPGNQQPHIPMLEFGNSNPDAHESSALTNQSIPPNKLLLKKITGCEVQSKVK